MADTWASFVSNGNTQAADDISRIGKLTFGDGDFSNAQKEAAATPGDGVSQQRKPTDPQSLSRADANHSTHHW